VIGGSSAVPLLMNGTAIALYMNDDRFTRWRHHDENPGSMHGLTITRNQHGWKRIGHDYAILDGKTDEPYILKIITRQT
jgi:hypothetical protein